MTYHIDFSSEAEKVVKKWKKSNPNAFKKLRNLIPELEQHPRIGTGQPEPLKGREETREDPFIYPEMEERMVQNYRIYKHCQEPTEHSRSPNIEIDINILDDL